MYEITVTYDRFVIRKAVRSFWIRYTWKGMFAASILFSLLVILLLSGDRSWETGFLFAVCLLSATSSVSLYFILLSRSMKKLEGLPIKEIRMTFTDERLSISTSNSDGNIPWTAIKRIWRFSDFWLVFFGGGASYFTLPLKSVDSMTQTFILQQVKAQGGRIK